MAIAFNAFADGNTATGTSLTWTHVCTGSDGILFVMAYSHTADLVTGVTYNGDAMTEIDRQTGTVVGFMSLWFLVAPDTGSHSVVVSASGSNDLYGFSSSYVGASQTGQPDSSNKSVVVGQTNYALATTVVAANSWAILVYLNQLTGTAITAGADTELRGSNAGYTGFNLFDSDAALAAGSRTLNVSVPGFTNQLGVIASFSPADGSTPFPGATLNNPLRG